jgi:Ca2+-binding RTX toxin-like protein
MASWTGGTNLTEGNDRWGNGDFVFNPVNGLGGNDTMVGALGADSFDGGDGDDYLNGGYEPNSQGG